MLLLHQTPCVGFLTAFYYVEVFLIIRIKVLVLASFCILVTSTMLKYGKKSPTLKALCGDLVIMYFSFNIL